MGVLPVKDCGNDPEELWVRNRSHFHLELPLTLEVFKFCHLLCFHPHFPQVFSTFLIKTNIKIKFTKCSSSTFFIFIFWAFCKIFIGRKTQLLKAEGRNSSASIPSSFYTYCIVGLKCTWNLEMLGRRVKIYYQPWSVLLHRLHIVWMFHVSSVSIQYLTLSKN